MNRGLIRYVRGTLQVTRALGDLFLKRLEFYQALPESVRPVVGPPPFIPPYVSHTPEVVLKQVRGSSMKFAKVSGMQAHLELPFLRHVGICTFSRPLHF